MHPSDSKSIGQLLDDGATVQARVLAQHLKPNEIILECEFFAGGETAVMRLICGDVRELSLKNLPGTDVAPIRVWNDHPILEDFQPRWAIYGQAPMPDPYRFFLEFSRVIEQEYGRKRDVRDYLNWGSGQGDWLQFVYSRSYHLLEGPKALVEKCQNVLDAQAASYVVLPPKPENAAPVDSSSLKLLEVGEGFLIVGKLLFQI